MIGRRRAARYRITQTGSALHVPTCRAITDNLSPEGTTDMTIEQARQWLNAGDRRFTCAVCLPADPRHVGLV